MVEEYLADPSVLACAGGFMARSEQIEAEKWEEITELCARIAKAAEKRPPLT